MVGAALAVCFALILGSIRDNELVEITLTTIVAYMSFIIAEHYLHVSGVMATATAGIILGGWGRTKISPSVSHFMHSFWEYLAFVANSLIFVLVGLALSPVLIFGSLTAMLLAIPIVYFGRAVGIALMVPIVNRTRMIEPIDGRYQLVMFWGGLRGALALALALSLPPDFAARNLILVAAMGVVMATLLVNALTIGSLLRLLGLDRLAPAELFARFESIMLLKREIRGRIPDFARERAIAPAIVERVGSRYRADERRIEGERKHAFSEGVEFSDRDRLGVLANQALRAEKRHYWDEFANGHLTEQAYKQLLHDVDYQSDHVKAYGSLPDTFQEAGTRESFLDHLLYRLGIFKAYAQERRVRHIADRFEQNLAKSAAAVEVTALLNRIQGDSVIDEDITAAVRDHYRHRSDKAHRELTAMATDYPEYVERTQEFLLTRSCLTLEQTTLEMLRDLGLMPDKAYVQQQEEIRSEFDRLRARPVEALRLDPESLLAQIQLFGLCAPDSIQRIAAMMESESFAEGDDVVRQGESGDSMYVIARGTVEVLHESDGDTHMMALLCAGGFFGEIALLADTTRTATVRAAAPCTLLRLRRGNLEKLMEMSPDIHDAVHKAYKERLAATEAWRSQDGEAPAGEVSPA